MKREDFINALKCVLGDATFNHLDRQLTISAIACIAAQRCFMNKVQESQITETLRQGIEILDRGEHFER